MCFKKTSDLRKARVNIVCYKAGQCIITLRNTFFRSGIRDYVYRMKKTYRLKNWKISQFFNTTKYVHKGYHSYKNLEDARVSNFFSDNENIVECIIPKGSHYYENILGEYVSDQIFINKKIA